MFWIHFELNLKCHSQFKRAKWKIDRMENLLSISIESTIYSFIFVTSFLFLLLNEWKEKKLFLIPSYGQYKMILSYRNLWTPKTKFVVLIYFCFFLNKMKIFFLMKYFTITRIRRLWFSFWFAINEWTSKRTNEF